MKNNNLKPNDIRLKIIKLLYKIKASHLGPNLSVVEMLIEIYNLVNIDKK